ncbi:MAG TPA: hypothetical protein VK502_01345 [Candidatus Saccharimonadales bacterium]|nr:hypothetical protein [Candidatus Saccharimonadales bacterium]
MESQEIFNALERDNTMTTRQHLIGFLDDVLLTLKSDKQAAPMVAYEIAGMLSTHFSRSLPEGDPLLEIMIIAGELEVESEDTEELTQELIKKIEALSR